MLIIDMAESKVLIPEEKALNIEAASKPCQN